VGAAEGHKRKGSLYPLLEILHLPLQADRQGMGCLLGYSSSESFQPPNRHRALREREEGSGLPASYDGAGCASPPTPLSSAPAAVRQAINAFYRPLKFIMEQKMFFREKQTHPVLSHQLKLMSHISSAKM